MSALPTVTVVVPTRNNVRELMRDLVPSLFVERPRGLVSKDKYSSDESSPWIQTVFVDQSPGSETGDALKEAGVLDAPQVTYLWTPNVRGISRARNDGVRAAKGAIVAFLDSDIIVSAGHVSEISRAFQANSEIAAMFAPVLVHEPTWQCHGEGTIPSFEPARPRIVRPSDRNVECGMGANFAIRREIALRFPYDEFLGAGAEFPSCEELDQVARMARQGHAYGIFTRPLVHHTGIRRGNEVRRLVYDTEHARGAMHAKQARCANFSPLVTRMSGILSTAWNDLWRSGWPRGIGRIRPYSRGLREGLLDYVVDESQQLFKLRKSDEGAGRRRSQANFV